MSADQMEVVEKLLPCWFSFSMDTYSCSFEPDEDFVSKDLFLMKLPMFSYKAIRPLQMRNQLHWMKYIW
jgi:hypothetical protein